MDAYKSNYFFSKNFMQQGRKWPQKNPTWERRDFSPPHLTWSIGSGEAEYEFRPPMSDIFFWVHTILHDILGFDTIITQYLPYFRFGKNARKLQEMRH